MNEPTSGLPAGFLGADWLNSFSAALEADPEWASAVRFITARIGIGSPTRSVIVELRDGQIVSASPATSIEGVDFALVAPDSEWQRVREGAIDLFSGLQDGVGQLAIAGDAVAAFRCAKVLWLLIEAMRLPASLVAPSPTPSDTAADARMIGRYVDIDGMRTYYEEAGAGQVILCLHAACQDTMMYRHLLAQLSDRYHVIAFDAPSHGKSLDPAGGPLQDLTQQAAFTERFIEQLGLERPVLIGCSMGGNQVLELGSRRPEAYAAIISAEGADHTPTLSPFLLDMMLINGQQLLEGYSRSLTGRRTSPERAREVQWQIRRCVPSVMRADLAGYADFDKRGVVGRIAAPVLLIRGSDDWLVSQAQLEATASRIPHARITVLAGTGHYPMIENPKEFIEAICLFLADERIA